MKKIDLNNKIFKQNLSCNHKCSNCHTINNCNDKLAFKWKLYNFLYEIINHKIVNKKTNKSKPYKRLEVFHSEIYSKLSTDEQILLIKYIVNIDRSLSITYSKTKIEIITPDITHKILINDKTIIEKINNGLIYLYEQFQQNNNLGREFIKRFTDTGINICPYCNMDYVSYIEVDGYKGKIVPTIDHIEDKGSNPFMNALNIDNMIPSCYTCNSNLKGSKELNKIYHPYSGCSQIIDDFNFHVIPENGNIYNNIYCNNKLLIDYINNQNELEIYLGDTTIKGQELSFYIKKRLESRQQVIKDILVENLIYNNSIYQKGLLKINGQYSEYYNQKETDLKDIHKIPYSKLYLDIKKQIGI